MDGTRSALIVASDDYTDPGLRALRAPASDAQTLAAVLRDPGIGGFEVRTLLNEPAHEINLAVEEFFADRRPDDLLLLHFSCHGVKDEGGELHFAAANTKLGRLGATAVAAEFVNRRMSRSRSRRVVLLLDCCYAGAFERGMTARAGAGMDLEEQFGGRGRAVITASSAMEYAFEGNQLTDARELAPSVFTSALVEGLETGEADRDQDGLVGLDELYDYVYDRVRAATPNQTPGKWTFGVQGDLVIARRSRPVTTPAPLPPELQQAIDHPLAAVRAGVVQELARLLQSRHAGLALAGRTTLERLTEDDSRMVSAAAAAALGSEVQPPQPQSVPPQPALPQLVLSATVVEFGRLPQHSRPPERTIRLGNAGGGTLNARVATQASWLKLRQLGDELVIDVDTSAAGEHEGVVRVESDGGSAAIHVLARVDPTPLPAPEPTGTIHPDTVPGAPEPTRPSGQEEPAPLEAAAAPVPGQPPATAPEPIPPPAAADGDAASRAPDDRRLSVAGGLAIVAAVLLVVGLAPPYLGDFRFGSEPALVWYALVMAALAAGAGVCTLLPRTRRLIGPGILLGTVAASTDMLLIVVINSLDRNGESIGAGFWLEFIAHVILVIAACLAGLAVARAGEVRVTPGPPQGVLPRLVVFLGVAGAVALLSQFLTQEVDLARDWLPLTWATVMALVVPACAAVAVPRRFGAALLAGWLGGGASLLGLLTGFGAILAIIVLLVGLFLIIPFTRAAPSSEVQRTRPSLDRHAGQ